MNAPTEEHLDDLASALIPTLVRVSEYGWSLPEPDPPRREAGAGRLRCVLCGQRLNGHELGAHR